MHILIIKTSSLGDIIHTFPALTDAAYNLPGLTCDWVVEENFMEAPTWHPAVQKVLSIALRRWRQAPLAALMNGEMIKLLRQLHTNSYDLIIDAQGLFKSAIIAKLARGNSAGFNYHSARESLVGLSYNQQIIVPKKLHAIERIRRLFATALNYSYPATAPKYGLRIESWQAERPYLIFVPATTWISKYWPANHWAELIDIAMDNGYLVFIPWYGKKELSLIEQIIKSSKAGALLPNQTLNSIATWLAGAAGVIGVDSGLTHLAVALNRPTVMLYGPTSSKLTGAIGAHNINVQGTSICAPCYNRKCKLAKMPFLNSPCLLNVSASLVWESFLGIIPN